MPKKMCIEVLSTGRCRKKAIKGSNRCIFHDPEMWRHEPGLLRRKIKKQIHLCMDLENQVHILRQKVKQDEVCAFSSSFIKQYLFLVIKPLLFRTTYRALLQRQFTFRIFSFAHLLDSQEVL